MTSEATPASSSSSSATSGKRIKIGIIGGTGLNNVDLLEDAHEIEVNTLFGKPSDKLVCGRLNGVDCVLLSRHDKQHLTGPSQVNYRANMLALRDAGCQLVVVTTACGSLDERYRPGDLVVLDDFIDRTTRRTQTYHDGTQPEHFAKICHMPMYPAFCGELRALLVEQCAAQGVAHHASGTIVCVEGPRFSSRAESRMFRAWGAQLINMTTCPEVVLAKELGLPYVSLAIVTDYDCWREQADESEHVGVESVLKVFRESLASVTRLLVGVMPRIAAADWTHVLAKHQQLVKGSCM